MTITTAKLTSIAGLAAIAAGLIFIVPVPPHAFERLLALPMGVALAALGCSLWSRQRNDNTQPDIGPRDVQLDPIGTW